MPITPHTWVSLGRWLLFLTLASCASLPLGGLSNARITPPSSSAIAPAAPSAQVSTSPPVAGKACLPDGAVFGLAYVLGNRTSRLAGGDAVLLSNCNQFYVQRVGEVPKPLTVDVRDLQMIYIAPDQTFVIGLIPRRADGQAMPTGRLVKRFSSPATDQILYDGPMSGAEVASTGRFATIESGRSDAGIISLLDLNSLVIREVFSGRLQSDVRWSPDGRTIAFIELVPDHSAWRLRWASVDAGPSIALTPHDPANDVVNAIRGSFCWAPDSQALLVFDQNPMLPDKLAHLVTLPLSGTTEVNRAILDTAGHPLQFSFPRDVQTNAPGVLADDGILDPATATVELLPFDAGIVGWAGRSGKLLRWRQASNGPILETVDPKQLLPARP